MAVFPFCICNAAIVEVTLKRSSRRIQTFISVDEKGILALRKEMKSDRRRTATTCVVLGTIAEYNVYEGDDSIICNVNDLQSTRSLSLSGTSYAHLVSEKAVPSACNV